jgi:Fic-DOC domain mobile mystery protein B
MNELLDSQNNLGATPLDADILDGLRPKFITTRKELYDAEFKNISQAINKYFTSQRKFIFTRENLYKVHKEMYGLVWCWAGEHRKTDLNLGVEWSQIDIELKKLLDDFVLWGTTMDPIEVSARLHHRLVAIHPFYNGNGRWSRVIANIYLRQKLNKYVVWPEDDLFISSEFRKTYISALQDADGQNYQRLIDLHKKYLLK